MPKILDYNTLTTTAGCNVLFIGDKNSSITNPEIKNITVDNLFKRETFYALNANGITFYDDGSNVSLFIKDGGNIGIGGTTANYALQVNGTFHVTGGIYDTGGSAGTTGKFLKVTGTDTYAWTNITTSDIGGGGLLTGGIANYIPKWSDSTTLTNSVIYESSSKIGIGETSPGAILHIVGAVSGSDAIVQNNPNGAVIELRRDSGTTATNSLYISNTSAGGFSLGNANTGGASNINFNASGQLGVKTTDFDAALNVSETNNGLIGDFYSNNSNGSWIYFKNTDSNAYSNVLSYSNCQSSTQRVNWITGTFKNGSNQYFGIHHKTAQLNASNAVFDNTTVCNNLFYVDTGGCAYLAHGINTHNKTNSGHNTGRFVQVFTHPLKCFNNTGITAYMPAINIDPRIDSYSAITDPNSGNPYPETSDEIAKSVMPYAGKLIAAYGNFNVDATAQGATCLSFESSNNGVNAGYLTASFDSASASDNCILTFSIDSSSESYLEFTAESTATIAWCAPSGRYNGASLTFVYEFDIT